MDVVKRNIDKVRGRIEIASTLGQGTTFTVRLPLTLAVTDGMLVRVGSERYVVPTTNIHMSFRPEPGMLHTVGGRGEVVTLRGEVMPVVRLHALFGVADAERDPARAILMLVGDGERKTALLVDELLGQHQVVVKALGDGVGARARRRRRRDPRRRPRRAHRRRGEIVALAERGRGAARRLTAAPRTAGPYLPSPPPGRPRAVTPGTPRVPRSARRRSPPGTGAPAGAAPPRSLLPPPPMSESAAPTALASRGGKYLTFFLAARSTAWRSSRCARSSACSRSRACRARRRSSAA
jgi:hypothetical protein